MTILYIGTDDRKTGAILSMLNLAREMARMGNRVLVVVPAKASVSGEDLSGLAVRYVRFGQWTHPLAGRMDIKRQVKRVIKYFFSLYAEFRIARLLKKERVDLVHINTSAAGVGAKSAKRQGKTLIWHIREFLEDDHGYWFNAPKKSLRLMAEADAVIAISDAVRNKFLPYFKPEQIKMVYNGIRTGDFLCKNPHALKKNPVVFLCVGRFLASKGQTEVIDACGALLRSGRESFELWLLGDGTPKMTEQITTRIETNGLSGKVRLLGFQQNVRAYMEKSDVVVVASRAEAFGRVTIEAMLSGNLVIGADTGGTAELIEDGVTGLLYRQGDGGDLCAVMSRVTDRPERFSGVVSAGQAFAAEHFSVEKNAREIDQIYKQRTNG